MKLTFCGGTGTVTGANYLLESGATKILVDCGMHQGERYCEEENFKPFPYDPREIAALVVTHAHVDHTGRIPLLVKKGFRGRVISTAPTRDLAAFLLADTAHVIQEDAREGKQPALYTEDDVARAMTFWEPAHYHEQVAVGDITIELVDAGHVLGSASALVTAEGKRIAFSGDLGNNPSLFLNPTERFSDLDYALIESAYGDRVHDDPVPRREALEDAIEEVMNRSGTLMIPAFALERTQEMIYEIDELVTGGKVPHAPVFIDSPLAIRFTEVYRKYERDPEFFNAETVRMAAAGEKLFEFPGLKATLHSEESRRIREVPPPKIVIAGSGMSQGGRILFHERNYLGDPKNGILFVGFQAAGSLGRAIADGARSVEVLGETVPVRATVRNIEGYSAHADQNELMRWVEPVRGTLKKLYVVQGEEDSSRVFAQKVRDELAVDAQVPSFGEEAVL